MCFDKLGGWGIDGHVRRHSWALFKPGKCLEWRPLYVQALNQWRKGVQMQAWGKWPKVMKAWARGQHLMGDMQLGPLQTGFHNCKDV